MELTIYALIYWNDNFKSEVKKMLNKKVFSTMFLLGALLVGCSSTNDFSDDKVKNNKEKVEVVEEQKEQIKESNENESIEENSNANDQVTGYNEQIESNSNDTYVQEVKETPLPEDNGEREIILCQKQFQLVMIRFLMVLIHLMMRLIVQLNQHLEKRLFERIGLVLIMELIHIKLNVELFTIHIGMRNLLVIN